MVVGGQSSTATRQLCSLRIPIAPSHPPSSHPPSPTICGYLHTCLVLEDHGVVTMAGITTLANGDTAAKMERVPEGTGLHLGGQGGRPSPAPQTFCLRHTYTFALRTFQKVSVCPPPAKFSVHSPEVPTTQSLISCIHMCITDRNTSPTYNALV